MELDKKLSAHLADALGHEYSKISKVFSITEGITIEKYFIKLKIEKVKGTGTGQGTQLYRNGTAAGL